MNQLEKYGVTQRFINEATLYPEYSLARIISQHKGMYRIITSEGERFAEISGKFSYEVDALSHYPAVGDFVMVTISNANSPSIIHAVLTRKSVFQRTALGLKNQTQIIATNIDIVFICMSLNQNYNLSRLERYLAIAWDSGAKPVIILTKSDLCQNTPEILGEIESVALGCDVILTSSFDAQTVKELYSFLKKGITASFIGSSGVGKSTLINILAEKEFLATNEIDQYDKGRHTTTGREMLLLPNGAIVIDTPGMRELGVPHGDLGTTFLDIEELAKHCKFRDCSHTNEPGCAVQNAILSGQMDERRLQNYNKLKREAKYEGLSSRKIEEEKVTEMFSEFGGIKNAKRYLKNHKKHNNLH
ncbi:putative ribosome biogenesis GTPase RsgA [Anaerotignum neopropionicum]|uniref:Small ribosomal subunit biogenesis GTPase RsgA n=1 Tax=Anaerotignum neopropionicum TaxID=36847 RepID=A0A136WAX3_9FIRM|nr:ribosome small subunit-dependent GTPase A [Anaerotignum neopropionicum]KXL51672.1 putative ribosome biogenesis GTPase RsgA [Anaerotignum neopropionicum]